ncbi:MAG TPA: AAA family ATPase, partial [Thermodesulfobium narugense]|nr:AAA family ATPase [Thermodesulfobium narugense]
MDKDIKDIKENQNETKELPYRELPLIPLKDTVIFPHMVVPLFIGRDKSLKALEEAMLKYEKHVLVVSQKKPDEEAEIEGLYQVGVIANILQILKLPDGHARIVVQGTDRAKILSFKQTDPFFLVEFEKLEEEDSKDPEIEAMVRVLISKFEEATKLGKNIPSEAVIAIYNISEPSRLSEYIATHLINSTEEKQLILETTDLKEKLKKLLKYVQKEISILEVESRIKNQINQEMEKHQKEFYLREQIKAIQKELGEAEEKQVELEDLKNKIKEAKMPPEVEKKVYKEISRLEKMPSTSAEVPVIRTYLDWVINLPWSKKSKDNLDILKAEKILEREHYGLKKVKERIIEFLAIRKLTKSLKGPILCFVGPPGVGKTSLGKSIAAALNRKFIRIALGGMRDEAEIRGHRKTYVGALPGRIIQSISQVQTNNPVFMMDEIDKVGTDFRGDPTS